MAHTLLAARAMPTWASSSPVQVPTRPTKAQLPPLAR